MTDFLISAAVILVLPLPLGVLFAGLYWMVDEIELRMFLARLKNEGKL